MSYTLKHPLHSFCNLNFMSRFHCNLHFKLFVHGKFPGFPHAHTQTIEREASPYCKRQKTGWGLVTRLHGRYLAENSPFYYVNCVV